MGLGCVDKKESIRVDALIGYSLFLRRLGSKIYFYGWFGWVGGWEEKWGLKLTSAKVEVEVEAERGKNIIQVTSLQFLEFLD